MDKGYLDVANSWMMWVAVSPVLFVCLYQAYSFAKKAFDSGHLVDLSKEEATKAFKVGMTSSIGPALGVFVVMLGLMAAIGGPIAWQRLSIIGAAPTELAAATQAATAMEVELGGAGYGLKHFANAAWVMALNGGAWLLFTALFTDKLEIITQKVSRGNTKTLGVLGAGAILGSFAYLFLNEVRKGLQPNQTPILAAALSAMVAMVLLERVAKKYPKLTEYNLGIAMLVGMFAAVLVK